METLNQKGIGNILIVIIIIIILAIGAVGVFYFLNQTPKNNPQTLSNSEKCPGAEYGMDCEIVKFLEANLAWTNNEKAKAFCSYDFLGEEGNNIYISAFCESFYVNDKETFCPDSDSANKCFISKDCGKCEKNTIAPRLISDSGISVPARLTKTETSFTLAKPLDGSGYSKSLREIFPAEFRDKLSQSRKDLSLISIARAETYFNVRAFFATEKILDFVCEKSADCPEVPGEYAMRSNCPFQMNCIDKKCVVGCYDFIDHETLPKTAGQ
ncbi:MAG: hypothetical protein WC470_03715 [Candidatus Paceibacterota bacterium]